MSDPFADPRRAGAAGTSSLSVIPRSPFDLDDDDDDVGAPYVPSSDDTQLLARDFDDSYSGSYARPTGSSRTPQFEESGPSGSAEAQNELNDGMDAVDYAGGNQSANPATMGEPETKDDRQVSNITDLAQSCNGNFDMTLGFCSGTRRRSNHLHQ